MLDIKKCVTMCMEKYNLTEEEATRIAKTDDVYLSLQELKYKYDNPYIGTEYPEWLTPTEHLKMCYKTAKDYYSSGYSWYYGVDEVSSALYIWSSLRLHKCNDVKLLKRMLVCRCMNIARDVNRRCYTMRTSLNNLIHSSSEDDRENEYIDLFAEEDTALKDAELLASLKSIKDKQIREMLIMCGYFIAELDSLFNMVVDIYENSTDKEKEKLYEIFREDERLCEVIHKPYSSINRGKVAFTTIRKSLGIGIANTTLKERMKVYLGRIGFLDV